MRCTCVSKVTTVDIINTEYASYPNLINRILNGMVSNKTIEIAILYPLITPVA